MIGLGIRLAIGLAIRLVQQQDVRSTGSHDANGGDVNDANGTGSSDNNRQRCNARFVIICKPGRLRQRSYDLACTTK